MCPDCLTQKTLQAQFQGPDRDYKVIRARSYVEDGIDLGLVRVTAAVSPDLASYDPAEDADLYAEFLPESGRSAPIEFHKIWIKQCEAAEHVEADYGTEKALGYLIGEKLLNFLEVAEAKPEWHAEVPHFIAKIKELFPAWQIAEFFENPRRLGTLGHVADEEEHKLYRSQVEDSVNLREDARNLLLFERAREWLMEDGTDNTEM